MAFIPAPGIIQLEWRATNAGQHIENRLMVDVGGAVTPEQCAVLAQLGYLWFDEWYGPALSDEVSLDQVVATDMSDAEGAQVAYGPAPIRGSLAGDVLPNETSKCVSLRSANRGRSARGRFYWLAITNNQRSAPNTLAPTVGAGFVNAIEALRSQIEGLGYFLVIVSYISDGAARPGGPVYFPVINSVITSPTLDSMRSRKPGVGT